jgi:hypothetical protein
MKKAACILLILLIMPLFASAATLDEIQKYGITVNMRNDGTMDIYYRIEWRVLDDQSEGPLSWVQIGMPNQYIDQITAHTNNIKRVSFSGSGGSYVRVDFDRKYYRDEVITFEFSIHESRMYTLDNAASSIRYSYTPGWFDQIEVKAYAIRWSAQNVRYSDSQQTDGGYLIWAGSLKKGQRATASLEYAAGAFSTDPNMQYYQEKSSPSSGIGGILVILIIAVVILAMVVRAGTGAGMYRGGFYGGYIFPFFGMRGGGHRGGGLGGGSTGGGGCACASSCACACACAGGGRAGCSVKGINRKPIPADITSRP